MSFVFEMIYWVVFASLGILGSGALITAAILLCEYFYEKGKRK